MKVKAEDSELELSIFNRENRHDPEKIQLWINGLQQTLKEKTFSIHSLAKIFETLAELKVFDVGLIKEVSKASLDQLHDSCYSDLSIMLYSFQKLKYTQNIDLIQAIVNRLIQLDQPDDHILLSRTIFSLAKLKFYNAEYLQSWTAAATSQINRFDHIDLLRSIQGIATLKISDENLINSWLQKSVSYKDVFNPQMKLNIAFYLSMISINNDLDEGLNSQIKSFIGEVIEGIDLESFQDDKSQQQIIQIYLSETCYIKEEIVQQIKSKIQVQGSISTSFIQRNVEQYIAKYHPSYKVYLEYYDQDTAAFTDILVKRDLNHPEYDIYIEVDGPTHYYTSHRSSEDRSEFITANTLFRNKLHALHNHNLHCIRYIEIDQSRYYEDLLTVLNTYPEGYVGGSEAKAPALEELEMGNSEVGGRVPNKKSDKTTASKKTKKLSPAKKLPQKITNDEFDSILKEYEKEGSSQIKQKSSPEEEFSVIRKKYANKSTASFFKLLTKAINAKNIEDAEFIMLYSKKKESFKEEFREFGHAQLDDILSKIQEDPFYFEIYKKFTSQGYGVKSFTLNSLKGLIFAFKYGDTEVFEHLLSIIPESEKKLQLMEYFLINCGIFNNVEIASLLLELNIDINSCYSANSVQFLEILIANSLQESQILFSSLGIITKQSYNRENILNKLYSSLMFTKFETIENIFEDSSRELLKDNTNIYVTALSMSCGAKRESDDIRLFLLKNNANPNVFREGFCTSLIFTLISQDEETALQLLDYKPNLNLKSTNDITAAHLAAKLGLIKVIKKMTELKVNLEVKVTEGVTITALEKKLIFEENDTPLTIALRSGDVEMAGILIDEKVDLNYCIQSRLDSPISLLEFCIFYRPRLVNKMLENGANVNFYRELPPLDIILRLCHKDEFKFSKYKIFEALLTHGVSVDEQTIKFATKYALIKGYVSAHQKILELIYEVETATGEVNIEARTKIISMVGDTINFREEAPILSLLGIELLTQAAATGEESKREPDDACLIQLCKLLESATKIEKIDFGIEEIGHKGEEAIERRLEEEVHDDPGTQSIEDHSDGLIEFIDVEFQQENLPRAVELITSLYINHFVDSTDSIIFSVPYINPFNFYKRLSDSTTSSYNLLIDDEQAPQEQKGFRLPEDQSYYAGVATGKLLSPMLKYLKVQISSENNTKTFFEYYSDSFNQESLGKFFASLLAYQTVPNMDIVNKVLFSKILADGFTGETNFSSVYAQSVLNHAFFAFGSFCTASVYKNSNYKYPFIIGVLSQTSVEIASLSFESVNQLVNLSSAFYTKLVGLSSAFYNELVGLSSEADTGSYDESYNLMSDVLSGAYGSFIGANSAVNMEA